MGCLYLLTFGSSKRYVGITEASLPVRLAAHRKEVGRSRRKCAVHRAWKTHGEPVSRVLALASGKYLLDLERLAVKAYGTLSPDGYNMTPGGDMSCSMTPEIKARISAALKGKKLPPETRAKMSAAQKKRAPITEEVREKIKAGQRASEAFKNRRSPKRDNVSGRYLSDAL